MGLPSWQIVKILVIKILIFVLITPFLVSCSEKMGKFVIDRNYLVHITDVSSDRALYYDLGGGSFIGRIPSQVTKIGWDNNFIIAEIHRDGDPKMLEFYLLDKNKDSRYANPSESVSGPLSESELQGILNDLGVAKTLKFTKIF